MQGRGQLSIITRESAGNSGGRDSARAANPTLFRSAKSASTLNTPVHPIPATLSLAHILITRNHDRND